MKYKRLSVLFALILVLSTFFSSFAFAETNTKKNLVALGDSITFGWNLDKPNQTEPSSLAFPYLIDSEHYNVTKNISFPGWTSNDLLNALQLPENIAAITNANAITLDIGSNDLLKTPEVAQILANPTVIPTQAQIDAATQAVMKNAENFGIKLGIIVGTIKQVNPNAPIILYNIYNPFGSESPALHALGEQIIPQVNEKVINLVANQTGAFVADAYTTFNGHQSEFILRGDIHPTVKGHQVLAAIADEILASIEPLTIDLTPSTTEPTKAPVTITVSTNAKEGAQIKWLPGEKTADDFIDAGNAVTDNKFQVTENGKYTVYVMDTREFEAVKTIEITNITKDNGNPTPNPGDNGNHNPTPTPAPTPTPTTTSGTGHALPNTATPMFNYVAIGLVFVLTGLVTMILQQYRRREN